MTTIHLTIFINAPIERVFDLSRSIDLHKLSTAGTNEKAVAGVTSGLIGKGQQVTWRAKHFGITQALTSEITQFQYPYRFRDEMMKGAFRMIKHDHLFERSGDKTVMRDKFEFKSPGWILGIVFNKLILIKYLHDLLINRNKIIKEVAESERWKQILKM